MKQYSIYLFTLLCVFSLIIFSCQKESDLSESVDLEESSLATDIKPELPSESQLLQKSAGIFVSPSANQKFSYGSTYSATANRNSVTTNYAIGLWQPQYGAIMWNDYWGSEGRNGIFRGRYTHPDHRKFKTGIARFIVYHWNGNGWIFKGAVKVDIAHNWLSPFINSDKFFSVHGTGRCTGDFHSGVDFGRIAGPVGQEIRAVENGYIMENKCEIGSITILHHARGRQLGEGYEYMTRYRHLDRDESLTLGSYVRQGQAIGTVAARNNGQYCSDNFDPHLHFEYYNTGQTFHINDPDRYSIDPAFNICHTATHRRDIDGVLVRCRVENTFRQYCQTAQVFF